MVWFEVEDFLRYFDHFRNPTGLQRVPFEIFVEAERLYGRAGRVRFCRLSMYSKQLIPIGFDAVISAYSNPPGAGAPWKSIWAPARFWSEFSGMLPVILRHPRFFLFLSASAARDLIDMTFKRRSFARAVRPGDVVVSLGASWGFGQYVKHIAEAKRRHGIQFSILIYDLIPVDNEAFVERRHLLQFRKWLEEAVPAADVVLTISNYSRGRLVELAADAGWSMPRVEVLGLGTGLSDRPLAKNGRTISFPPRYVLFVSTIEIRKNHRLLVRVWRRLLDRYGAHAVPVLVFAGQIGWLVNDLLADLATSDFLGGKIVLMPDLTDAELRHAYRSCLFTIFPESLRGLGPADCGEPRAGQVLRCLEPHIDSGGGRRSDRLFRPGGR